MSGRKLPLENGGMMKADGSIPSDDLEPENPTHDFRFEKFKT